MASTQAKKNGFSVTAYRGDAKKLLAVGESKADEKLNPAEFAAMTMIVNQVMNLDEVLVK